MPSSQGVKKCTSSSQRNKKFSALEGMAIKSRSPSETRLRRKHMYSSPSSTRKSERLEKRVRKTPAKWKSERFVSQPSPSPLRQNQGGYGVVSKTKRRDLVSFPKTKSRLRKDTRSMKVDMSDENECVELSIRRVDSKFMDNVILPGLPDEVAKYCLAFVPASNFGTIAVVSKKWRAYVMNKEMMSFRRLVGTVEEWLYVLGDDDRRVGVFDSSGQEVKFFKGMPEADTDWFGVVHLDGKLIVLGGLLNSVQLSCVFQFDCRLGSWSKLASMNVARYAFACAEVNGIIYVAGGVGISNEVLSSVEAYDADENKWTMMDSLRYARDFCFGCDLDGKFYVMGGSIPKMIRPFEVVEIYDPEKHVWHEPFWLENTCHFGIAPVVMEKKLYLLDDLNEKMILMIWKVDDNSWETVPIPSCNTMQYMEWLGVLNGKVFVFFEEKEDKGAFLCYDPHASPGHEWHKICNMSSSWSACFPTTVKV